MLQDGFRAGVRFFLHIFNTLLNRYFILQELAFPPRLGADRTQTLAIGIVTAHPY